MSNYFNDQSYYKDDIPHNKIFSVALEDEIIHMIAGILFKGDATRVQYSSNADSFRKRTDENNGHLNLPFANFRLEQGGFSYNNDREWNNTTLRLKGTYIPELNEYVRLMPVTLSYEASFWCSMEDEVRWAGQRLLFDRAENKSLPFYIQVNDHTMKFPAVITTERDIEFDTEYNQQDWLDENQIRNVGFDFEVHTYMPDFPQDTEISITETAILRFAATHSIENYTPEQIQEVMIGEH